MDTVIAAITGDEKIDGAVYAKASDILHNGGLVAFPTETVYGLGADAFDAEAAARIYEAKGRPSDNPLIIHIAQKEALYDIASDVPDSAIKLADAFWPGPLTIILKKQKKVPYRITGGLETVAVRMPSHPVAARLIRESGVYIAAPSANKSGRPSPTKAEHVIEDLNGRIDMIIQEDTVDIGLESTIIDLSEPIATVLRPGYITIEMLKEVLGTVELDKAIANGMAVADGVVPKAPGMKYRHYAPRAQLTIVEGDIGKVIEQINILAAQKADMGLKVGIMTTDENMSEYKHGEIISLGMRTDEASIARHLFEVLREFDSMNVDYIYSEGFDNSNVGQAVMNRLLKAAGHSVIEV